MEKKPDPSIFYSLAIINEKREAAVQQADWGSYVDLSTKKYTEELEKISYDHALFSCNKLDFTPYAEASPLFKSIIDNIYAHQFNLKNPYYNSAKYYADCFTVTAYYVGNVQRIVAVGADPASMIIVLAGLIQEHNVILDIVDIDQCALLSVYKQIMQIFPNMANKVRLFFGDLPIYIHRHLSNSSDQYLIHYQASTNFNDVIRDLGATYFQRNKIVGTMVYNTHLRSTRMHDYAFTDVALYALFGHNIQFIKLGNVINDTSQSSTLSDTHYYHSSQRVDGLYIPYSNNQFRYPHPNTELTSFLYQCESLALVS